MSPKYMLNPLQVQPHVEQLKAGGGTDTIVMGYSASCDTAEVQRGLHPMGFSWSMWWRESDDAGEELT